MPITAMDNIVDGWKGDEESVRQLVENGVISAVDFASAKAAQQGLPFVELTEYPVDRVAVSLVPAAICRRHEVLPIASIGNTLTLAVVDPGNVFAVDDVRAAVRMQVTMVVAERKDLLAAIDRYHRADGELSSLTTAIEEESGSSGQEVTLAENEPGVDDAPIVRFVNLLISQGIQDKASDIHIEPGQHDMGVRYRIDGVLHEMQRAPKAIQNGVISRLKIMSDIDIAERRKPQDGRLSVNHGGRQIDLRVATLPTVWGEKVVMRILDNSNTTLSLTDLNMLDNNLAIYRKSFTKPNGMILVTGPTGSGKSTTLYTTLHAVAKPEVNVITVEDPVEYRMPGINQVQVNPKAGLTFASALRSILRSDPDVVLIGEIRDQETAQIAIEASLTGHLVLSTLHTNDSVGAITRLINIGVEPFLVANSVIGVIAQRLARKICPGCKQPYDAPDEVRARLNLPSDGTRYWKGQGCQQCFNSGHRGRLGLYEIFEISPEARRLLEKDAPSGQLRDLRKRSGETTLFEEGMLGARAGQTSLDEVLRVAWAPAEENG